MELFPWQDTDPAKLREEIAKMLPAGITVEVSGGLNYWSGPLFGQFVPYTVKLTSGNGEVTFTGPGSLSVGLPRSSFGTRTEKRYRILVNFGAFTPVKDTFLWATLPPHLKALFEDCPEHQALSARSSADNTFGQNTPAREIWRQQEYEVQVANQ